VAQQQQQQQQQQPQQQQQQHPQGTCLQVDPRSPEVGHHDSVETKPGGVWEDAVEKGSVAHSHQSSARSHHTARTNSTVTKKWTNRLSAFRNAPLEYLNLRKRPVWGDFREQKLDKKLTVREALRGNGMVRDRDRWVVNPENNKVVNFWDMGTMLALVYVALVTPVEVALLSNQLDALFFINVIVDIIFLLDMVLQFFIVYRERTPYGYRIETSQAKIIRNYVRTWFSIDLLSVLPYSYVSLVLKSAALRKAKVLKTIRLLRLIKLVRVVRASRVFQRWETSMAINYNSLRFWTAITVLLLSSHWIACIWALIASETDGQDSWLDHAAPTAGDVPRTPAEIYFTALYWSSITVTSVGYGDVIPVNFLERVFCTLLVFSSGLLWAYALGEIMTTLANIDVHAARFRQSLDDLNYMMRDQAIPKPMQRKLRSFFFRVKDVQRVRTYSEIVSQLSPSLQGEVALAVNEAWVRKVWYFDQNFSQLPNGFMSHVSVSLEIMVFAGLDIFYEPWTLYTLQMGVCVRSFKILNAGSVWGEDFILSDETLLDKATVLALTFVQVAVMRSSQLKAVIKRFPEVQRLIRHAAIRIAVVRGMWREARRRSGMLRARRAGGHHFMDFAQVDHATGSCDSIRSQTVGLVRNVLPPMEDGRRSSDLQMTGVLDEQAALRIEMQKLRSELRLAQERSEAKLNRVEEQLSQLIKLCAGPSQALSQRASTARGTHSHRVSGDMSWIGLAAEEDDQAIGAVQSPWLPAAQELVVPAPPVLSPPPVNPACRPPTEPPSLVSSPVYDRNIASLLLYGGSAPLEIDEERAGSLTLGPRGQAKLPGALEEAEEAAPQS